MAEKPTYEELERRVRELEQGGSGMPPEEALTTGEKQFREIIELSRDIHYRQDVLTGALEYVSPSVRQTLGYSAEELMTMGIERQMELLHPEDLPGLLSFRDHLVAAAGRGERHFQRQFRMIRKSGEPRWIVCNGSLSVDDEGRPKDIVGNLRDITDRKQAEEAITRERDHAEQVLNTVEAIIVALDREGRITLVNPKGCRLLGYPEDELIGRHWFSTYLPQPGGMEEVYPHFLKLIAGEIEAAEYFENPIVNRNGELRQIAWHNALIRDEDGTVTGTLSAGEDITERKTAEEALRSEEEKFRMLVENTVDWVWQVDPNGRYTYVSPQAKVLLGYEVEEIHGKTPFDFMSPSEATRIAPVFARAVEKRERILGLEDTLLAKDGAEVVFETNATPLFGQEGEMMGFMGTCRDITRRKLADEALRESEERFRMVFHTSPDSISLSRLDDGVYLDVNEGFTQVLGYMPDEVIGRSSLSLDIWEDPADRDRLVRGLRERGCVENLETRFIRRDGEIRYGLMSARILRIRGQEVIISITRDMTERKLVEKERKEWEARAQQAQKMESIGTLAGGIAHDFNNILGIIVGNTELAMFDIPQWSPAQESLREVREASLRARDLITQILLFARRKDHTLAHIRVGPIARESLKMLRASIPSTVEIQQEIQEDLPTVLADSAQIQQIIMNLCTNAGQVMDAEGGILRFKLDLVELTDAMATPAGRISEGPYVRIQVSDTGPGIAPEHMERIFEPFFTTKGVGEGTGLGLAVVHGIVQDRHGGITVESGKDEGTAFAVYLPASDGASAEQEVDRGAALPRGNERILFVDDEPLILKLGRRMLERQGYEVETRANGTDALECFRQDPARFDLVVTDMTMPGLRGDHLTREMLKIRPDIPVILSTGFSKHVSEKEAKELGIRAFVMKPLTAQELADTVRKVLDEKPAV